MNGILVSMKNPHYPVNRFKSITQTPNSPNANKNGPSGFPTTDKIYTPNEINKLAAMLFLINVDIPFPPNLSLSVFSLSL